MRSLKRTMRGTTIVSASILALTFGYQATADELRTSSGSSLSTPAAPNVGEGYRPDPTRKTLGEMERDLLEGKNDPIPVQPTRASDMNRRATTTGSSGSGGLQDGAVPTEAAKVGRVRVEDLSPELRAAVIAAWIASRPRASWWKPPS